MLLVAGGLSVFEVREIDGDHAVVESLTPMRPAATRSQRGWPTWCPPRRQPYRTLY
ncbi:hypothetical protein ACFYTS_21105 [Nocardia sp. NPDC004151]|uniref:hypothetical protein n=1 Tax=Nocardia sp. NPDC004151 TaxID=3364304 RepID=UPI00369DB9D2